MSEPVTPTLEDLRQSQEAAWLWDGARGRVVWANAAGIAAFDGRSLFDLIDRPFDPREQGISRIAELTRSLQRGEQQKALLHFPSVGLAAPVECTCHIHALADGRPGLLVVMAAPKPRISAPPERLAGETLAQLPLALLLITGDGAIIHCNEAARQLVSPEDAPTLADLLQSQERAGTLLARLASAGLASSTESIKGPFGLRELKLVITRVGQSQPLTAAVLLEDVTERRALERQIMAQQPAVPAETVAVAPPAPAEVREDAPPQPSTNAEAFAKLSQSLEATLRKQTAELERQAVAKVERNIPFVPDAVRVSLENTGEAILIIREGQPLFVSSKAAGLLNAMDAADVINADAIWSALVAVVASGNTSLPRLAGGDAPFAVSRARIPWHNGAADQFVLRAVPAPPAADKPVAPPAPAAPPSPKINIPAPAATPAAATAVETPAPIEQQVPVHNDVVPAEASRDSDADKRAAIDNEELRAILDVASDGIITLDRDGRILSFSAGAEAIFGHNFGEVIEKPLADLLNPESRKSLRDYLAALNGPGLASVFNDGREVSATTRQGGSIPLFLTVGKLQSPHSRAAFCAVVRDITPWKRTEKDLREAKENAEAASRQKSDFLARVSHELRTPLNAIMGFSEVMRLERFGEIKNDKYRAYANDIHASGGHLLALINDLLDLSKVEAGKLELDFTAVSIEDAADHAIKLLQEQATTSRVLVRRAFPAKLPRIVADHRSLRQIMLNLLSNAIKYTDAGGQVIVSATIETSGAVAVRVKDTGIGMTETQVRDALEPFARVETSGRARQGTGLGLPLTKALVEANRAQFSMTSQPGKGTLVEITFPGTRVLAE